MKRLPGVVLLFALGCAENGVELPPVEVGGASGARLMTGAGRTPEEAYENAYAQLTKQHLNVRRALEPRGQNLYGAALSMQSILDAFERMRSLATAAYQARFDPWIEKYAAWKKDIERNTWGGSFRQDFDQAEVRVKEALRIENVELVSEFPGAGPKAPAAAPPARPVAAETRPETAPSAIPPDKAVPPPRDPASPGPSTAKGPEKTPDPSPAPTPAANGRLYYKAWDRSHDDLAAAYKSTPRPDCRPKFEDVVEALKLLKATMTSERAQKLQVYLDFYGGLNEKTKGFTVLPEKTSDKDLLNELDVISQVIRREFNPDK